MNDSPPRSIGYQTTPSPKLTYYPHIDGLRAVAILLVVIYHAFPGFLSGGFIGVNVFFVISGFRLVHSLFDQGVAT